MPELSLRSGRAKDLEERRCATQHPRVALLSATAFVAARVARGSPAVAVSSKTSSSTSLLGGPTGLVMAMSWQDPVTELSVSFAAAVTATVWRNTHSRSLMRAAEHALAYDARREEVNMIFAHHEKM